MPIEPSFRIDQKKEFLREICYKIHKNLFLLLIFSLGEGNIAFPRLLLYGADRKKFDADFVRVIISQEKRNYAQKESSSQKRATARLQI